MIYANTIKTLPQLNNTSSSIQDQNKLLTYLKHYSNPKHVSLSKETFISEMDLFKLLMSKRHKPKITFDSLNKTTPFQEFERLKKENKEVILRRKKFNTNKEICQEINGNYLYQIKKLHTLNNQVKNISINSYSHCAQNNSFSFQSIRNNTLIKSYRSQLIKEKRIVNEFLNKPLHLKSIGLKLTYSKQNKDCGSQTEAS